MPNPIQDIEDLRKQYYATMIGFFSGGTYDNVLLGLLDRLIENFTRSSESSDKLTIALNRITLAGTVIAAVGLLIAAGSLSLEFYKTFMVTPIT